MYNTRANITYGTNFLLSAVAYFVDYRLFLSSVLQLWAYDAGGAEAIFAKFYGAALQGLASAKSTHVKLANILCYQQTLTKRIYL